MQFDAETRVPIDELVPAEASALHRRFFDYWRGLRRGRAMPAFADIDPVEIPWALRHIFVVELRPGGNFVYRLAGEDFTERYGRNLKGAGLADIMTPEGAEAIVARWSKLRDLPAASFVVTDHLSHQGIHVLGERLVLPLAEDRAMPNHLIGVTHFTSESAIAGSLSGDQRLKYLRWSQL